MYYERVYKALQEQKIRYAVAGGVALVLHGAHAFKAVEESIEQASGPGGY
jgi:hypothetical protein